MEASNSLKLITVYNKAYNSVLSALKQDMEKYGINSTEFMVMELLLNKGKSSVQDIAKKIMITSGSMTYVVNRLIDKKMIEKNKCEKDNRIFYISLSEHGDEVIKKAFESHKEFIENLTSVLSEKEKKVFIDLNKKIGEYAKNNFGV